YFVLFISSLYSFLKLSKIKLKWINMLDILVAAVLASALYYATIRVKFLVPIGFLLFTCLYTFARYRKTALITITNGTIACGFSVVSMVLAPVVILPFDFLALKFIKNEILRNYLVVCVLCILQLLLTFLIFRIKRLKSGISIQNNDGSIEMLLLISILCIFLMTLFYMDNLANSPFYLIVLAIIFCGLALIVWWKKHVTNNYLKQIHKRNELIYEQRIEEYEKERLKLLQQNEELSKIIHRDNKLIPAMVIAVKESLSLVENKEKTNELLARLEELSSEHNNIIETYQTKSDNLPKTEIIALDSVLHFIYSKALQNRIECSVSIEKESIPPLLSQINDMNDLFTILCDLGENAIIAAKNVENGNIKIAFELSDSGAPTLLFYDNGAPFDEKVIANMGKRRITTRKADGGSGIGLMTLFELLSKYDASYCLDETLSGDFTKLIKLTFDKKLNFSVKKANG
ncbi:MAG: GHKL domain-containing protein, partial [Clostridia bacterium]|nr:GHKL domain-containing protein [Clostridia bacterium]